ncbi:hypothetical protein [Martelella mediterranea]|uniref:Uncharacterized protein n=1 Tax=Martelella mediterranea DSM 17316 TaxID=1122214 RepID=A0A1U9YX15_9HYPH|nr:hypothetical protein [Martelella mediterranea]AQZ49991.1 hypothetical protein Mame_00615 [Martelella mediterranea DSM 17316]
MWDIVVKLIAGLILIFCVMQLIIFAGLIAWGLWTDSIKPRLIPSEEITRAADELIEHFADPSEEALLRQHDAWYRSDGAAQTYWRRVRKSVATRLEGH